MSKNKALTVILSVVPGLGHMYLGWMERGLQFMLTFFVSIFLIGWLNTSFFALLLPVIWFYSLFDALQLYGVEVTQDTQPAPWGWLVKKQRWVGFGLIAVGVITLINRIAIPWLQRYFSISYYDIRMVSAGVLALIFIAGGIKLALGKQIPADQGSKKREDREQPEGSDH